MTCQTKVEATSELCRQLVVSYISSIETQQSSKPPRSCCSSAPSRPLPEALALYMKKRRIMSVKLLKYVVKRNNGGLSYFVSLLAYPDPLSLPLPLPDNKINKLLIVLGKKT